MTFAKDLGSVNFYFLISKPYKVCNVGLYETTVSTWYVVEDSYMAHDA